MLAEKFFLVLETLRSHASDGCVKAVSPAQHVPLHPPPKEGRPGRVADVIASGDSALVGRQNSNVLGIAGT